MPPQAAAANLPLFYSFEQFISDQQKLAEFATRLHTKGFIVARICNALAMLYMTEKGKLQVMRVMSLHNSCCEQCCFKQNLLSYLAIGCNLVPVI